MGVLKGKSAPIRRLLKAVWRAFAPDTFPVEDWRPQSPDALGLTSARDPRFWASVIAMPDRPGWYSVMVELYEPPDLHAFPFEIAVNGEFSRAGVVDLLARYREWTRR
jgi:hypothetical protein